MSEWALALALVAGGLASGFHCAAMCGGISGAFSLVGKQRLWRRQLAFNAGRISTYAAAGALAGTLGSAAAFAASVLPAQVYLYFFAGAFTGNALPHFVSGVTGRAFQSPFARPPGKGLSSSIVPAPKAAEGVDLAGRANPSGATRTFMPKGTATRRGALPRSG